MNGPIVEGTYQGSTGAWFRVEQRHYPKTRWVVRPLLFQDGILRYAGTETPKLTQERWAELSHDWLTGKEA